MFSTSMNPTQPGNAAARRLSQATLDASCAGSVWFITPSGGFKHARAEGKRGEVD